MKMMSGSPFSKRVNQVLTGYWDSPNLEKFIISYCNIVYTKQRPIGAPA